MNKTKISAVVSADDENKVIDSFKTIEITLPFMVSLPTDENIHLRKMGVGSVEYVQMCYRAAAASLQYFPANYPIGEFKKGSDLWKVMQSLMVQEKILHEKMADTITAIGANMMEMSDEAYAVLKRASKKDAAVKALVDQISVRFKGQGVKKKKGKSE